MAAFRIRSCWLLLLACLLAAAGASESRLAPETSEDEAEAQAVALLQSDVRSTRYAGNENFPSLSEAWHGLLRAFHRGDSAEAAPQDEAAASTPAEHQQELVQEKPAVVARQPASFVLSGSSEAEKVGTMEPHVEIGTVPHVEIGTVESHVEIGTVPHVEIGMEEPHVPASSTTTRFTINAVLPVEPLKYQDVDPVVLHAMETQNDPQAADAMQDPISMLPDAAQDTLRATLPEVEIPEDGQVPRAVDSPDVEMIPPQLVAVLSRAESTITEQINAKKDSNAHAQQETAEWILAIFGEDNEAPLDGTNESAVVDRLTAFILRENPTPAQEHGNWTALVGGQPSKTFFNENRIEALERMIERDNLQASRALNNRNALMGQAGFGVNSHGAHSGYNQKFDLLPEEGRSEEAGHMWHIELTYSMDVDDHRLEVIGTGIVEHHRPAVAAALAK